GPTPVVARHGAAPGTHHRPRPDAPARGGCARPRARGARALTTGTMASVSDTRQTGFQRGAASVRCSMVPWDTAIMGSVVGQLEGLRTGDPDETAALLGDILGWSDDVSAVLVACRLDHRALTESMALESIG